MRTLGIFFLYIQPSDLDSQKGQGTVPVSEGFRGRRLWGAGTISSLTFSETLARSLVASSMEQCSVLVPSMDRMWSPGCRAPLLARSRTERVLVREKEPWASYPQCRLRP